MSHARTDDRLRISDIAIRHGLTYQAARELALKGTFGQVERVGARFYVTPDDHERE